MSEEEDYLEQADRARQLANSARSASVRDTMLTVAAQYEQLAAQAAVLEGQRRSLQLTFPTYVGMLCPPAQAPPTCSSPKGDAESARENHPKGRRRS
jgi:hypothetical protein